MEIEEDDERSFIRAGSVRWESKSASLLWEWERTVPTGFVVYLMVVDRHVRKGGKAEDTARSTFKKRMGSEFSTVRQVILGPVPGRPLAAWRMRKLDPFKEHAPPVLLAGRRVDLYARSYPTQQQMKDEEDRLNEKYRGDWTKQGWTRSGERRLPEHG